MSIHETAVDLHRVGGMDTRTMRRFDTLCLTPIQEMTPKKIRALRAREKASQTVFAAYLNVTPSLVSKGDREKSIRVAHLSNYFLWWRRRAWRSWHDEAPAGVFA